MEYRSDSFFVKVVARGEVVDLVFTITDINFYRGYGRSVFCKLSTKRKFPSVVASTENGNLITISISSRAFSKEAFMRIYSLWMVAEVKYSLNKIQAA